MANRVGNTASATEVIPAGHAALTAEEELDEYQSHTSTGLTGLSVAALGIVFGDIGTSPVYTPFVSASTLSTAFRSTRNTCWVFSR
jgi:K+ transporter